MFSAVFRCSQLFCDIFSWVITFMDNHTSVRCITNPCTRILLSSLYEVGNLWQDQDASVDLMLWGSFQMKVWTLMIQRNLMIPGIQWSHLYDDQKEISIRRMDFDNPKVYGDTSISDGLVLYQSLNSSDNLHTHITFLGECRSSEIAVRQCARSLELH